jgi:DNA-binding MarR family transcriptional regulator
MPPSPEPDLSLTDALVQLSFAIQATLGAVAAAHDLSVVQLRLLGILRDREPGMLDLARALNLEKSSVTGLVDRAQRRGFVERVGAEHDGRAVHVRLTAAGQAIAAEGTALIDAHIAELTAGLPAKDRVRLARLAGRIALDDAARRGLDLRAR